ncbi:hypothetical protein C3495_10640 [Clostridiaceae bacterium 14S0207]|nr:hypothetical protein C3495_10640 [Clostridiaceae bacterium 14S0207]
MKDCNGELIQELINKKNYNLIEIKENENVKNIWCLSKMEYNKQCYILFLNKDTYENFNGYKQIILSNTRNSNIPIEIYFVVDINMISEEIIYKCIQNNMVILDFKNRSIKYVGNIEEKIRSDIEQSLQIITNRTIEKKNFIKNNKGTSIIIAINIIAFILTLFLNLKIGAGVLEINTSVLYKLGGLVNIALLNNQFYRFITCMFLHGGVAHVFFNMYALYAIGPVVENVYGTKNFLIIYFIAGLTASILSSFTLNGVAIGASGAIFGVLGAVLIFAYNAKRKIGKGLLYNIIAVIFINIIIGLSMPNIDNKAHIIGLVSGIVVSLGMYQYNRRKQ